MFTNRQIHDMAEKAYETFTGKRIGYSVRWDRRKADGTPMYAVVNGKQYEDVESDCAGFMSKRDAIRIAKRIAADGYTGVQLYRSEIKTGTDGEYVSFFPPAQPKEAPAPVAPVADHVCPACNALCYCSNKGANTMTNTETYSEVNNGEYGYIDFDAAHIPALNGLGRVTFVLETRTAYATKSNPKATLENDEDVCLSDTVNLTWEDAERLVQRAVLRPAPFVCVTPEELAADKATQSPADQALIDALPIDRQGEE